MCLWYIISNVPLLVEQTSVQTPCLFLAVSYSWVNRWSCNSSLEITNFTSVVVAIFQNWTKSIHSWASEDKYLRKATCSTTGVCLLWDSKVSPVPKRCAIQNWNLVTNLKERKKEGKTFARKNNQNSHINIPYVSWLYKYCIAP